MRIERQDGMRRLSAWARAKGCECSLTLTTLMAQARKITPEAAGHLNIRPPLKPLMPGEPASMSGQAATHA